MQNINLYIIKLFYNYSHFMRYHSYLDSKFLEDNNKELGQVYRAIALFHEHFPEKSIQSTKDLEVYFYLQYPATTVRDKQVLTALFQRLEDFTVDEGLGEEYVKAFSERVKATRIALAALEVSEGRKPWETLQNACKPVLEASETLAEDVFVTDDLEELYHKHYQKPGLRWRLNTLNQMLGSLRQGDMGFIFARPETGKTTFLSSEVTFMAEQTDRPILWLNNEQPGGVVKMRCVQAALGLTTRELHAKILESKERYLDKTGGRIKIYDSGSIHKHEVERLCQGLNPALIIFDQIDKVKGFEADRTDLTLKAVYQWARELSKQYGPFIGVCQAGGTGEGKRYLTMDDVDSSKTAKQGEADWILGIGATGLDGYEEVRHFHLCKNKLVGDSDTDPKQRHGKRDVLIKPEIGRYEDV